MNKMELINAVAENGAMSKKDAKTAVETVIETIMTEIAKGGSVNLAGFGVFNTRDVAQRTCRNPKTGEAVKVAAHKQPFFKFSSVFKTAVR